MGDVFEIKNNFARYAQVKSYLRYGDATKCGQPTVSVLMPIYNRSDYFKEALLSAINQDYQHEYEIVVTDNSDAEVANLNLQVVKEIGASNVFYYANAKNIGLTGNWNRCIELAKAPFVTYCHDDDTLLPIALSRLMSLQKISGEKAILSVCNTIDATGNLTFKHIYPRTKWGVLSLKDNYQLDLFILFTGNISNGEGALFSKQCLLKIGGYNEIFFPTMDYALNILYTDQFGSVLNNVPTFNYRDAVNISYSVSGQIVDVCEHIRKCIANKLSYPSQRILDRIMIACRNVKKNQLAGTWGGEKKSQHSSIKMSDKIIMRLYFTSLMRKKYKLRFSLCD
jgi:glycosyltransferase involved in cell wall biosynthesis